MSEKLNVFSEFEGSIVEIQSHLDKASIADENNAVICASLEEAMFAAQHRARGH
jgi:hypothetical protein